VARRRGRLVALLSAAQLARRPGGQRLVVVVTVAVALLSFAATAWDVAAQARRDHAADALGADRVYTVAAEHPGALVAAVATADPLGHAMAVVRTSQRYGDESVELLGVQSARLPSVVSWRGHPAGELGRLSRDMHPAVAAPLTLTGGDVAVQVNVDALPAKPPLRLAALVAGPGEPPRAVPLGILAKGAKEYRAALPQTCGAGCRLAGFSIARTVAGAEPVALTLSMRGLRSGATEVAAGFEAGGRWRVARPAPGVAVRAGPALGLDVNATDPADVVVEYVDSPDVLPAVLAGRAPADDAQAAQFRFPGLAEQPLAFQVVSRATALPRAGAHGVLFDFDYAVRAAERTSSLADNDTLRYEVWAAAAAPADLDVRLSGSGVQVLRTETMHGYVDQLGRRAPALGLWLYLFAGAAAILLAVGVVLLTAYVGVRGRLYELAALRVAGVRPALLRRAVLREYRLLLGAPLLVGFLAGAVGALLMLPGVPLVTVGVPGGALTYRPGFGALPVAVVVSLLGFVLAVLMILRLLRRATPDRLREGLR
jgi:putative ABC transport system permease protein